MSLNDASLAGLVPPAIHAASAATRAADLTQTKLKECLDALQMLSGHLKRHSEITSAVAVEMRRQPACQELAIERELVAGIQAEASQRAAHIARLRGHCTTLTPFSQALDSLKAEAAQKLHRISQSGGGGGIPRPTTAIAAVPSTSAVTKDRLDTIERDLQTMNAHVNQLVRLQTAAVAPPIEQAGPMNNAAAKGPGQQQRQFLETSPEPVVVPPPKIQEISPGGTEQPEIIRSLTYKQQQQHRQQDDEGGREGKRLEKEQQGRVASAPIYSNTGKRTTAEPHMTQSKALRGDAAPSSSTDNDNDGGVEKEEEEGNEPEFCFAAPVAGGSGGKKQQQHQIEGEEPSPTPQVAPNNKPSEEKEFEKENFDLTQSQGDGSGRSGSGKQEPENGDDDNVPATLPLENDAQEAVIEEQTVEPPSAAGAGAGAVGATAPVAIPPANVAGINAIPAARNLLSQRDSYSPGNTLNPGSSGAKTGSGSGSGVAAAAAGAGATRSGAAPGNEDTPAGPSRVAPTPASLLCCPPPLPPPSFPSSASVGAAAGVGEKRNHHLAAAAGGSGGNASVRVKRTRFATEAAAATAFEREKSISQDPDAELPLSGPLSNNSNLNSDGSGSGGGGGGGAPGTADWKTPGDVGATPLHQQLYYMNHYHHQHKSWVPSTIKPARYGGGFGGARGNHPPLFGGAGAGGGFNTGGDHNVGKNQLFPYSQDQEDSPRVAGAQKGATPMFLNSFPTSGELGGNNNNTTPATGASWKAGGSDIKNPMQSREIVEEEDEEEEEEEQGGDGGWKASNQLRRRKSPGS